MPDERISQAVRDGARHLADRGQSLHAAKFGLLALDLQRSAPDDPIERREQHQRADGGGNLDDPTAPVDGDLERGWNLVDLDHAHDRVVAPDRQIGFDEMAASRSRRVRCARACRRHRSRPISLTRLPSIARRVRDCPRTGGRSARCRSTRGCAVRAVDIHPQDFRHGAHVFGERLQRLVWPSLSRGEHALAVSLGAAGCSAGTPGSPRPRGPAWSWSGKLLISTANAAPRTAITAKPATANQRRRSKRMHFMAG